MFIKLYILPYTINIKKKHLHYTLNYINYILL